MNEAELLFSETLKCSRLDLYAHKNSRLNKRECLFLSRALKRRAQGEPIQYILGNAEFMGLEFKITPDVLIPRPETEILVEKAISMAGSREPGARSILDIGTGSGCIAVSLAKFIPNAKITATDISKDALVVAKHNAKLNGISNKINFIHADLFTNYQLPFTHYDIIISNPPYIPAEGIDALQREVRKEPRLALDGGKDGLDFYRRIINASRGRIKEGGMLIMEMGFKQKRKIKNIFQKYENFEIIEVVKDYNNIDRVVIARKTWKN